MIKKNIADVAPVETKKEGFKGMHARYVWSADDGNQKFAMRIMEFEPNGHTSFHNHLEEHQFLFLEGEPAYVDAQGNETKLKPGDTVYCGSDEPHQIKNVGTTVMKMVCMIPILPGGDGKLPAPRADGRDYVNPKKSSGC
jgi:quercetin dioxygenase-like cupin family protein